MESAILAFSLALSVSYSASGQEQDKARFEPVASNVVSALNAKDADAFARDFNAEMRRAVPPEKLSRLIDDIAANLGRVVKRGEPAWPDPHTAVYPLTMERGSLELRLALDTENRIAMFHFGLPFEEVAANLEQAIRNRDAVAFGRDFNDSTRKAISRDAIQKLLSEIATQHGKLLSRGPATRPEPNIAIYPLEFGNGRMDLKIVLDTEGKIAGFWLLPPDAASASPAAPSRNSVALLLPFRGRWLVVWGGPTAAQNTPHHDLPNQRFALDLMVVGPSGEDAHGDKTRNEVYFAYGQEILAPAEGTVTDVIDGVRDNRPGSMNPYSAVGNAVILRLTDKEYAVFAHFKPGSIRVRPGENAVAGQVLALCGNSGNSSQPHLHFHLQQTPVLQDGIGIEPFFGSVERERDGKRERVHNYSPVKGDILSAPVPG